MRTILILMVVFITCTPIAAFSETINIAAIDWCPFICPNDSEKPGLLLEYTKTIFKKR